MIEVKPQCGYCNGEMGIANHSNCRTNYGKQLEQTEHSRFHINESGVITDKQAKEDCDICGGTGVMYVQNGPDDVDAEQCSCTE